MSDDTASSQFMVMFPCYTIASRSGQGVVTQPTEDGDQSVVLLTDEDLLQRYREEHALPGATITFNNAVELLFFFRTALANNATHVTIDPKETSGWFPPLADVIQQVMRQYGIV
ncbi:MAG: hypothetical protein ABSG86_20900 [Thermoguttaceae bacterium]|jgi:hypothetical protein